MVYGMRAILEEMHLCRNAWTVGLLLTLAGAPAPAPAPILDSPLSDLAWLSGTWRHQGEAGSFEEETWSAVSADAMVGMYRMASEGRVGLYELMSIELEGPPGGAPANYDGPGIPGQERGTPQRLVFRLRHFERGLKPWDSEAEGPLTFQVTRLAENEVVFENPASEFPREIVYRRAGDVMTVRLVSATEKHKDIEFMLHRAKD
jgi:hypothetical protein